MLHSAPSRARYTLEFFTTITILLSIFTTLSTLLYPTSPTASLDLHSVKVRPTRPRPPTRPRDILLLTFDLTLDARPLFTWNTKQVFTYLSITYASSPSSNYTDNELIFWDMILPDIGSAKLELEGEEVRYKVSDISGSFSERGASVRLGWNVQPYVGALRWGSVELDLQGGRAVAEEGEEEEGWSFGIPRLATVVEVKKRS
ncbi:hypothetical protein EX30DRAFT_372116 [Ascodesmis nigricans]|uniref:Signal peptidase subunit 3 n=1 Tax=Ascodesmis nigricans TaxID=341454 RepID=A0A4S2MV81_9PEZI|nr:hypothetical protein EX30DRAFT_372116 [Ascodesmis nigricans]